MDDQPVSQMERGAAGRPRVPRRPISDLSDLGRVATADCCWAEGLEARLELAARVPRRSVWH